MPEHPEQGRRHDRESRRSGPAPTGPRPRRGCSRSGTSTARTTDTRSTGRSGWIALGGPAFTTSAAPVTRKASGFSPEHRQRAHAVGGEQRERGSAAGPGTDRPGAPCAGWAPVPLEARAIPMRRPPARRPRFTSKGTRRKPRKVRARLLTTSPAAGRAGPGCPRSTGGEQGGQRVAAEGEQRHRRRPAEQGLGHHRQHPPPPWASTGMAAHTASSPSTAAAFDARTRRGWRQLSSLQVALAPDAVRKAGLPSR